ncbi:MAG: hypothetical protein V3W41_22300 [Planctomycetota bacterium]
MADNETRTVAVRMDIDDQARLSRWRRHLGLKSDSDAVRTALRALERHVPEMAPLGKATGTGS